MFQHCFFSMVFTLRAQLLHTTRKTRNLRRNRCVVVCVCERTLRALRRRCLVFDEWYLDSPHGALVELSEGPGGHSYRIPLLLLLCASISPAKTSLPHEQLVFHHPCHHTPLISRVIFVPAPAHAAIIRPPSNQPPPDCVWEYRLAIWSAVVVLGTV